MTSVRRATCIAVLAALTVAQPTLAQIEQGRLIGTVSDAQGAVLPGVTVTARSPALIGGQTTITEADGRFRFVALPGGTYDLVFELTGFQTLRREGIGLRLGQTLTIDGQLQSGCGYTRVITTSLPNAGTVNFFLDDLDNQYSDKVPILDLRIDKTVVLGGKYRTAVMLDVYNVTNGNPVSNFNIVNGSQYNRITATLDPRVFQMGFRFEF